MGDRASTTPDVVIVGAGTAGVVLAVGLARRGARVLLLEAGPAGVDTVPAWSLGGAWDPALSQGDTVSLHVGAATAPRTVATRRGRAVGGSSAVNGTYFLRGTETDHLRLDVASGGALTHDRLTAAHAALERDVQHGSDAGHGDRGPIVVERDDALEPLSVAAADALRAKGLRWSADLNSPDAPSVGSVGVVVTNAEGVERSDTATAFLAQLPPDAELEVRAGARVERIRVAGTRVAGVDVAEVGTTQNRPSLDRPVLQQIDAPLVVLAAGAIGSAELLLRSGMGPAEGRSGAARPAIVDLPVGVSSWQHPVVELQFRPRPGAVASTTASFLQLGAHLDPRGSGDVVEVLVTRRPYGVVTGRAPTDDLLSLRLTLMSAVGRGSLRLDPADPGVPAQLTHVVHSDDVAALAAAARHAASWAADGPAAGWVDTWHGPDGPTSADPATLESWIADRVTLASHLSGTAPMGPAGSPLAAVDGRFGVHGVDGLAVVDTSVLPEPLTRGPAATAVALGAIAAEELG